MSGFTVERFVRIALNGERIIGLCGPSGEHVELIPVTVNGKKQLKAVWSRCHRLEYTEPEATPVTLDKVPEALLPRLGFVRVGEKDIVVQIDWEYVEGVGQTSVYRTHKAGDWVPAHVANYGTVRPDGSSFVKETRFRNSRPYEVKLRVDNKGGEPVVVDYEAERRKQVFEVKRDTLQQAGYMPWRINKLVAALGPTYAVYAHDWLCDAVCDLLRDGFEDPQRQLQSALRRALASKEQNLFASAVERVLYDDFNYIYFGHRNLTDLAKGALLILDTGGLPAKTVKEYWPSLDPEDYKLSQEARRLQLRKEQDHKVLLDTVLGTV